MSFPLMEAKVPMDAAQAQFPVLKRRAKMHRKL